MSRVFQVTALLSMWVAGTMGGLASTWGDCECYWGSWKAWTDCNAECHGRHFRTRSVWLTQHTGCEVFTDCASNDMGSEFADCNSFCDNGGWKNTVVSGCLCPPGYYGTCCASIVNCGLPGVLINGEVSGSVFTYGSSVTFSCDLFYNMTFGDNIRTCQSNGAWSGSGPVCTFVNTCGSNPCHNSGTCIDGMAEYTCSCAEGWSGQNCEQDIQPPVVAGCHPDMTENATSPTIDVAWDPPVFSDPMGHELILSTNYPKNSGHFPWGDFTVQYTATKAVNGLREECLYDVSVRPTPCNEINIPLNGASVCSGWKTDYGQYCLVFCQSNFTLEFDSGYNDWFVCGASGQWKPASALPACSVSMADSLSGVSYTTDSAQYSYSDCLSDNEIQELKTRFFNRFMDSPFRSFCTDYPNVCTANNVIVAC